MYNVYTNMFAKVPILKMVFGACHKVPPVEPVSHRSDRWASEAERGFWPPGSIGRTGAAPVGPVGVGTEKWPSGPRRHRSNRCSTGQTGERRGQKRGRLDQGSVGPTGASPVGPVGVGARKGASGLKPHRSDRCLTGPTGGRRGPTVSKGSFTPLSPLLPLHSYPFTSLFHPCPCSSPFSSPLSSPLLHQITSTHSKSFKGRGPRIRGGGPLLHALLPRALKSLTLKSAGNFSLQGTNLILARSPSRTS
jgi:hypothetical protein